LRHEVALIDIERCQKAAPLAFIVSLAAISGCEVESQCRLARIQVCRSLEAFDCPIKIPVGHGSHSASIMRARLIRIIRDSIVQMRQLFRHSSRLPRLCSRT